MTESLHAALLKHNQLVPRYTSYPTAPNFTHNVDHTVATKWLSAVPRDAALSLYFHIPFCKKMCWYCGCNTKATRQYSPVKAYLAYLKKEIELVAGKLGAPCSVNHIHFGGGSPSYIAPDDFCDLMQHIKTHFDVLPDAEIAIELDPREVNEVKVAAYAQQGVNRVSLGVQDFNENVQTAINRVQPFRLIFKALELLKIYGIHACNLDLLYGLPHQTEEIIENNIALATALRPDRISLFGYAHVPWMKKHMRLINEENLPNAAQRLKQFEVAKRFLELKKYHAVGLDHFVRHTDPMLDAYKAKKLQRNFQGYTTDNAATLIGFGSSAISSMKQGYMQNTPDLRAYYAAIDNDKLATAKGITLSHDDVMRRDIIEKIMCYGEVDLSHTASEYGHEQGTFTKEIEQLQPLLADELVYINGSHIQVNPKVPQANRMVAAAFDVYLQPSQEKHAQVA